MKLVNLESLSAAELFELASKKQKDEEKKRAEAEARAANLKKRRERVLSEHKQAIDNIDQEIRALQQKRAQLLAQHQAELAALEQQVPARSGPTPLPTPARAPSPGTFRDLPVVEDITAAAPPADDDSASAEGEDIGQVILDVMKGRTDISENLLRDQLRAKKLDTTKLRNHIDGLLKQGKIVSKGYGNFALKKKV